MCTDIMILNNVKANINIRYVDLEPWYPAEDHWLQFPSLYRMFTVVNLVLFTHFCDLRW